MNKKIFELGLIAILLLSCFSPISAVNIGELQNNDFNKSNNYNSCCEGYTLISLQPKFPLGKINQLLDIKFSITLIDMEKNIIKKWSPAYNHAKMLPNGSIITRIFKNEDEGKLYDNLTQIGWDDNFEWDYDCFWIDEYGDEVSGNHHDFQREGNPVGYYAPGQDFVENGITLVLAHKITRNSSISWKEFEDDVIYEVNWNGTLTGFEWHASDHIDKMGFNLKSRIGMWLRPGGPGLLIMGNKGDLLHINTISYLGKNKWYDMEYEEFNPNNIMITSRHGNFIIIIDKDTGKIVWRVGPYFPKNTEENKLGQIIGPHHAHIIPDGLPGEGNVLVFDNGGRAGYGLFGNPNKFRLYSKVIEFNPISKEIVWEYQSKNGFINLIRQGKYHRFYSVIVGSAQRLPNGNTLITEGFTGRLFEVTPEKEIVWEYLTDRGFKIYRAYRIPPEWVPGNPAGYEFWE